MRPFLIALGPLLGLACVLEALAAEPHARTIDVSRVLDAAPPPGAPEIVLTPTPPDPQPLVQARQWVLDLRWDRGAPFLGGVRALTLPAPRATPRVMGRFALELFEGPTLIERVRFDFPLLGGVPESPDAAVGLTSKLRTRIGVFFPATSRGTRFELVDRATSRRWTLPWPLDDTPTSVDGGASTPTKGASDAPGRPSG